MANISINKWKRFIINPDYRFLVLCARGYFKWMSDEEFLKKIFKISVGYDLNLKNPQSFNEKLQWLKIHDRKTIYTTMVDKYKVKQYVADRFGAQYIIPNYGVWESFDEIDFKTLPNQFVLKCTHDSGGVVICKDKLTFDKKQAKQKLNKSLKNNYYWKSREWPYKNVHPRIIAEEYMMDESNYELKDYKFFCFDGIAKAMYIASDRQIEGEETKFDFFDMDFNRLPFINGHPNSSREFNRPEKFDMMRHLAETFSEGIPQIRVDFYDVNGKIYFGEFTFYHWSGLVPFEPVEWDYKFGEWICLPEGDH